MANYYCPVDRRHGRLLDQRNSTGVWFCPHSAHGGNGRFFTLAQVEGGYERTEEDMTLIYETAAQDIVDGNTDLDAAVKSIAHQTNERTDRVRERLNTMAGIVKDKRTTKTAARAAASTRKAAKPARAAVVKKEHIEPAQFAAVRDELGLSNKEVIAALAGIIGAGPDGPTASRVTELTHSKGASIDTFELYEPALRRYAKTHPRPKASAKTAAAPAKKVVAKAPVKKVVAKVAAKPAARRPVKAAKPARPVRRVVVDDDEEEEEAV